MVRAMRQYPPQPALAAERAETPPDENAAFLIQPLASDQLCSQAGKCEE